MPAAIRLGTATWRDFRGEKDDCSGNLDATGEIRMMNGECRTGIDRATNAIRTSTACNSKSGRVESVRHRQGGLQGRVREAEIRRLQRSDHGRRRQSRRHRRGDDRPRARQPGVPGKGAGFRLRPCLPRIFLPNRTDTPSIDWAGFEKRDDLQPHTARLPELTRSSPAG